MPNNSLNHLVSPLRYPGGKGCIYKFMTKLFYENSLIGINYAEPYAGGAGLALRLLVDEYVNEVHINDLDLAIYAFWYSVLNHNTELCDWIEDVSISVETWKKYREVQSNLNLENYTLLDIAKSTFYLNRTNVSGVLQGGIIGGLNQKGKYKIDARFNKNNLIYRIERLKKFKHRIKVSRQDGVKFLKRIDKKKEKFFLYLDPPYVVKGADLYMNYFREKDHLRLCKHVQKINKHWMVSYDNTELILDAYNSYDRAIYDLSQSASNRIGKEVIIFDDKLSYSESVNLLSNSKIIDKCA